jgi:hypothetical protein
VRKSHFLSKEAATVSLVAIIASMSATAALANIPKVNSEGLDRDLSARVASVTATLEKNGAAGLRDVLGPEVKVAQWRNIH